MGVEITTALDGTIVSASEPAAELFGHAPAELVGRAVGSLVPALAPPSGYTIYDVVAQGRAVADVPCVGVARGGSAVHLSVSLAPVVGADGAIEGASVVLTAVGDDELESAARARLAAIVEWSDDAIVSKTLDGIVTSWNRSAEGMFGYSAAEAIGRSITLIVPRERLAEEAAVIESIRRGEAVSHFETVRVRKDGSPIDISLSVSPVRDATGRIIGASKIARDVTERKRLDAERARLLREAQESNAAKDEFLAMLGHELRNPLAAVVSAFQLLEQIGSTDPRAVRTLVVGMRQARHLARLIDDLIDMSRVVSGKIAIHTERVDLADAVRAYVGTFESTGRLAAHTVAVDARNVAVDADPARLEQIVANLLDNALRYTPPGGHVSLTVAREGDDAVLRVADDGPGIEAELLPRIFDIFVQSKRSLDRSLGGLGIGLALVRRLVELQRGSIEASSAGQGCGTEFVVRLPAVDARVAERTPARSAHPARRRVLVVEDNDDVRELLCGVLRQKGHDVHDAALGNEGLEAALRLRPDVVLLDIGLPDVDGYEVARRIRATAGDQPFLVAATGYGSKDDRERALRSGFDRHMRKPVDPEELGAILDGLGSTGAPAST